MQTKSIDKSPLQRLTKRLGAALELHPGLFVLALAFAVTLVMEAMSRHSLWRGVVFLFVHPIHFAANMMIVLVTLAIGLFFKKRVFFLSFFAVFWLMMGIVNAIILIFRTMPFGTIDILLLPSVISTIPIYLDFWQMVLIIVLIALTLTAMVFLFFKSPRSVPSYRMAALVFLLSAAALAGTYSLTVVGHEEARSKTFANISEAYEQYGFVYCFCTGALDQGIDKPDFYSQDAVNRLLAGLEEVPEPELRPNIIMVQLESFFDVSYLNDVVYDENPIPVFTYLKENYSSGFLTVPSIGAGTANTEFEVLSGMSLAFFGMGEYPYRTILQKESCETVATDLKSLGYTAHAIHNNLGTFYGRDTVFAQLGFDTFIPIEFMENVEYNPIGWTKDNVLTEEILKALDSTQAQDFAFTITVQGHGKYQRGIDSVEAESLNVLWEDNVEDSEALAYYLSQLRETDEFIGELVAALERRAEPTVLVLYGDHLPNFNIGTEQLKNGDIFETEYVIWNNLGLPVEDKNLSAYQLTAEVMRQLGIGGGILSRYHQQMSGSKGYTDGLELLEYDMLYGEFYCYGGENPYTASDLQMGVVPITISNAVWEDGVLTVYGEHFTAWSRISVDGDTLDTVFVDSRTITAELKAPPEDGAVLTVRQDTSSVIPSESAAWNWTLKEAASFAPAAQNHASAK